MKHHMNIKNLITNKFNSKHFKTDFQNIILSFFSAPFILIIYAFTLAIKTEFINDEILEMLASIISLILIFAIVGLYLMFIYLSIYTNKSILFKAIRLISLLLIFAYHIFIFIKKDIQSLNNFDDCFILLTSILVSYMIVKAVRNSISKIFNWIFNAENYKQDELIKFKLSFIRSIILGFITFIATVLGIALTIKQLFFT